MRCSIAGGGMNALCDIALPLAVAALGAGALGMGRWRTGKCRLMCCPRLAPSSQAFLDNFGSLMASLMRPS